jgi:hypothetical protein
MTIQRAITPRRALLYSYPVVPSILLAPALASCASTHLRYALTIKSLNFNLNTVVNTELHCVQLFIRYIRLVMTLMFDKLLCAAVYCHAVRWVLCIVE